MYTANDKRYDKMIYNRVGNSGLKLPAISLGLWKNFGYADGNFENMEAICRTAFDNGVTHFDLANNYGNPYNGSAEENFSKILKRGLINYRDELCISTKAGYEMWAGPYGDKNGSRKYLIASLDQSLKRMGLEYVDIFYHHIFDPDTPLEETAYALDSIVRSGKALYVGVSNYNTQQTKDISEIFARLNTPFIINQPSYSMLNRWIEHDGLYDYAGKDTIGLAVFSPLYQGFLSGRYLNGIASDSRVGRGETWIGNQLDDNMLLKLNLLNEIAKKRNQTLSQLALSWILRDGKVSTVLVGASRPAQLLENIAAIDNLDYSNEQREEIEIILNK